MNRFARCLLMSCLMLLPLAPAIGQGGATPYQLKAVFVYNFTQFVEWPADAFGDPDAPFTIGIYGPNVFGSYLDEAVRNEKVAGHRIRVIPVAGPSDARRCQLVFVSGKPAEIPAMLSELKGPNVLTVSDAEGFCISGGMIGLINAQNRIRIQVNKEALDASKLRVSSKLLRLAEQVSLK